MSEQKPLVSLVIPVIFKYYESDLSTSQRMARRIKEYRPAHEKKWPVFKKVEFRCSHEDVDDAGRISCDMDGEMFIQLEGQSDEDYFRIIQEKVLKKEHRILELVVNPNNGHGWYHRIPVFSELPIVKNFKFIGAYSRYNRIFEGLRVQEAFCSTGTKALFCMEPIKHARFLEIGLIMGRINVESLKKCLATHWNVVASITGDIDETYDDDWVLEKFASGAMEVGSFYKATRNIFCESMLQRMLQKYPRMVKVEEDEEEEKYVLDLTNGTKLMAWVVEEEFRNTWVVPVETRMLRDFHLQIVEN